MTRKHFVALADHLTRERVRHYGLLNGLNDEQYQSLATVLANFCADQNPRFNRERWLDYVNGRCGPNGGSVK